jgi:hypothetical protein|tara:strand:+ start:1628 stop:1921 length:294 start_codon:yes stop_codon:yes gene_type:complete
MSSRHFSGEKASKKEAKKALMVHTANVFEGRYTVKFESDDGGNVITLYLEVEEPSERLDPFLSETLWASTWMGWRYVITKCPIGYIDAILEVEGRDW